MPRQDDLYIDWDNSATFLDAAGEDVSSRVRAAPGISCTRGRDQIRALAPPAAGSLMATLDNQSQDYSPENGASPLDGNLLPGRRVRYVSATGTRYLYEEAGLTYEQSGVAYDSDATSYTLWTGLLDDLPQHPEALSKSVDSPALGTLSRLAGKTISTALYSSITTDVALGHLLDAAGWPAADRVLDTGKTTLGYWWLDNEDALQAALTLFSTEGPGAALYEDGQGRIVFESRHYRLLTARSITAQVTLRDTGAEPLFSAPFVYNPNLKNVINACTVTVKTRTAKTLAVIWSLGSTVTLGPNESRTYTARASGDDPFTAAVTPVDATDYTVSAGSLSTVSLDRTSGASVTVTLTAGSSGATVTGLQLRAQAVTVDSSTDLSQSVDVTTSQDRYGVRTYALPVRAELPINTAQDFCNAVVSRYQAPRATVQLTLNNGNDTRLTQALSREISDRLTVVEAQSVISDDFFIEQIAHQARAGGRHHLTTFSCEKAPAVDYAIWGTAIWGTSVWAF